MSNNSIPLFTIFYVSIGFAIFYLIDIISYIFSFFHYEGFNKRDMAAIILMWPLVVFCILGSVTYHILSVKARSVKIFLTTKKEESIHP